MPRNVEIKAYVDDLEALKTKACELSNEGKGQIIEQKDTFFNVPNGRLKLRFLKEQDSQLVFYSRPDGDGPKLSDYAISTTNRPDDLLNVLEQSIGIRGKVKNINVLH